MTPLGWLALTIVALVWPHGGRARRPVGGSALGRPRSAPGGSGPIETAGDARRRERRLALVAGVAAVAACLATGGPSTGPLSAVLCGPAAAAFVIWSGRRPQRAAPDRSLALCLDLVAAVLRAGRPVAAALRCAAPSAGAAGVDLNRVAGLLSLGADPAMAWGLVATPDSALDAVAAVAIRSHASGIRLADAFERLAVDIRHECAARAGARAQRAGVHAMAPLAACFLPSFVCLGIVPVVVGVAGTVSRSLI